MRSLLPQQKWLKMALIYKSLNNWNFSVLRDCRSPCLLSWLLRLTKMSLFFRPEQGKYEETQMRIHHLTSRKRRFSWGRGSWSESCYLLIFSRTLSRACTLLLIWSFKENNFNFNDDLEYSHLISHFSNYNVGVISICTKPIMLVFSTTMEAGIGGTYFY